MRDFILSLSPATKESKAVARGAMKPSDEERSVPEVALGEAEMRRIIEAGEYDRLLRRSMLPRPEVHEPISLNELKAMRIERGKECAMEAADVAATIVGERLREARRRSRLTQREAAECIGVSAATLKRIENGAREPTLREVVALCTVYDENVGRVVGQLEGEEDRLLALYWASTPDSQKLILDFAQSAQKCVTDTHLENHMRSMQQKLEERPITAATDSEGITADY